jgi:uncharacterized protein DUF1565
MNKYLILIFSLLMFYLVQGTTIIVDIEGGGDYSTIQEGIDAAIEGDTVLVYPGRYYENVWIESKSGISLVSLEAITGNSAYIDSTIIDGNRTGSCVTLVYNSDITIQGFSITNGFKFYYLNFNIECSGGLYLRLNENIHIENCKIFENIGNSGGMIIKETEIILSGLSIHDNYGNRGGGIRIMSSDDFLFDADNRCSIYNNFAGLGNDLSSYNSGDIYVVVDTFTVQEPDSYYCHYSWPNNTYNFYYDIDHAWQEEIDEDIYVSPEGDDGNSGLSDAAPLRTIAVAMQRIESDSLYHKTVHLAEGTYTVSENEQIFPINIKPYVNLRGESIDTVIHNDGDFGGVLVIAEGSECEIENLKLYNEAEYKRDGLIYSGFYVDATLKNLIMENYEAREDDKSPVQPPNHCYYHFENCIFRNNVSYNRTAAIWANTNIELSDCVFDNNVVYSTLGYEADIYCFGDEYFRLKNCIFTNSRYIEAENNMSYIVSALDNDDGWSIEVSGCIFYNHSGNAALYNFNGAYGRLDMTNCTFYNSECDDIPIFSTCTTSNFYNNIFYVTDYNYQLYVKDNTWMGYPPTDINMSHNLIYGGESSIWTSPNNNLNWLEGNIDADPLLYEQGSETGLLDYNSVCRDAGTLQFPEGVILPDTDLYGHPRVYGDSIDIGAVEWIPWGHSGQQVSIVENELPDSNDNMSIYPNPAFISEMRNPQLNIYWTGLNRSSDSIVLEIFNIFGQKIYQRKVNQELAGDNSIFWDFRNKDCELVPTGFYIVRLKSGNEYIMQKKLTVIK